MKRYSRLTTASNFLVSQSISLVKESASFLLQNLDTLVPLLLLSVADLSNDISIQSRPGCRDEIALERCIVDHCKTDVTGDCTNRCIDSCC